MKPKMGKKYQIRNVIIFLLPIIVIVVLLYFMIGWTVTLSLTKSARLAPTWKYIGLESYRKLADYRRFWMAIRNNLIWIGLLVLVATLLGLVLAYLINLLEKWSASILRLLFLSPVVLSSIITGTLWNWMYVPEEGVINTMLRFFRLGVLVKAWTADPKIALFSVIGASVWQFTGFAMALYSAALISIPSAIIENAQVEGASGLQILTRIIIPNLGHATLIVISMLAMFSLKMIFPLIWVMTRGGPLNSTEVLPHLMYITTFERVEMSMGAAINVIILFVAIGVVLPYGYFATKRWFA